MRDRETRMEDAILELTGIVEALDCLLLSAHKNIATYQRMAADNDWPTVNLNIRGEGLAWLSGQLEQRLEDLKRAFYEPSQPNSEKGPALALVRDDGPVDGRTA